MRQVVDFRLILVPALLPADLVDNSDLYITANNILCESKISLFDSTRPTNLLISLVLDDDRFVGLLDFISLNFHQIRCL